MGRFSFFRRTPAQKGFLPGVPCFPLNSPTPGRMLDAWRSTPKNGGVPVILVWDTLMELTRDKPTPPTKSPDLDSFVKSSIDAFLADVKSAEILGSESDEAPGCNSLEPVEDKNTSVVLAQVPVDVPWKIFRHIPFGGWNACPDSGIAEAFLKRWYERFEAEPVTVRGDALELIPARRPLKEEAYPLALEMFAFCENIVTQGAETIHALADSLTKSDVWFFWWD